jgi:hypothetical protein
MCALSNPDPTMGRGLHFTRSGSVTLPVLGSHSPTQFVTLSTGTLDIRQVPLTPERARNAIQASSKA